MRSSPASAAAPTRWGSSTPSSTTPTRSCGWSAARPAATASPPAATPRPSAAARPGVLHGARSFVMQDEDGQTVASHSISAGLDYPSVGPEHAWLADIGRAEYRRGRRRPGDGRLRPAVDDRGHHARHRIRPRPGRCTRAGPRARGGRRDPGEPLRPRRQGRATPRRRWFGLVGEDPPRATWPRCGPRPAPPPRRPIRRRRDDRHRHPPSAVGGGDRRRPRREPCGPDRLPARRLPGPRRVDRRRKGAHRPWGRHDRAGPALLGPRHGRPHHPEGRLRIAGRRYPDTPCDRGRRGALGARSRDPGDVLLEPDPRLRPGCLRPSISRRQAAPGSSPRT